MLMWLVTITATVLLVRMLLRLNVASCKSKTKLSGKVVIVTGANDGIGFHTAKALAARGARVILACRNKTRAGLARDRIIQETGNDEVIFKLLDLASLTSVRKFCEDFKETEGRLDVLVNNAGVYGLGDRYTEDGIIEMMQVNLFAPMLLTDLLLPLLKQTSGRIVNVTSVLHYLGDFKIQKVNKPGYYGNLLKYSNAKYGSVVFTAELARRLNGTGVCVTACHPGIFRTGITSKTLWEDLIFGPICWFFSRTAAEAAATPVHLCACAARSGAFYVDCARWPALAPRRARAASDLWAAAERLMGCKLGNMAEPSSQLTQ